MICTKQISSSGLTTAKPLTLPPSGNASPLALSYASFNLCGNLYNTNLIMKSVLTTSIVSSGPYFIKSKSSSAYMYLLFPNSSNPKIPANKIPCNVLFIPIPLMQS